MSRDIAYLGLLEVSDRIRRRELSSVAVTEALPKAARCLALSLIYATSAAVFGGTAQSVLAWLLHTSGNLMAPAWYFMASTAIALVAMASMRETAPAKITAG